jgi:DCN1-like protein 1/2
MCRQDSHDDIILAEGVSKFCEDLGVDPADIVMLVISYHFRAATMCEYSKEEFIGGMARLGEPL